MTSRRLEADAEAAVERAIANNDERIRLFRLLAAYEICDSNFVQFCLIAGMDADNPEAFRIFDVVHVAWMTAHMKLKPEVLATWLRLGHGAIRLGKRA